MPQGHTPWDIVSYGAVCSEHHFQSDHQSVLWAPLSRSQDNRLHHWGKKCSDYLRPKITAEQTCSHTRTYEKERCTRTCTHMYACTCTAVHACHIQVTTYTHKHNMNMKMYNSMDICMCYYVVSYGCSTYIHICVVTCTHVCMSCAHVHVTYTPDPRGNDAMHMSTDLVRYSCMLSFCAHVCPKR